LSPLVRVGIDVVGVVLGLLHRQELDRGDAEAGQRRPPSARRRAYVPRWRSGIAGVVLGQAADVDLVDDVVLERARGLGAE
jgi:hypothetical protein